MRTRLLPTIASIGLVAIAFTAAAQAQSGENRNLFETAGPKQTNKDFKPAPDRIEANFGTLEFEL